MTIAQAHENLSPENLRVTATVLASIDLLGELKYLKDIQKEAEADLKPKEHEISSICIKETNEFPFKFLTFNGFGYRMLLTYTSGALRVVDRDDAAQLLLDSRPA